MVDIDTIQRDIAALAEMRANIASRAILIEERERLLAETPIAVKLAALQEAQAAARKLLADMETTIRTEAAEYFAATGEKKPVPGVTIKMFRVARYDRDAAQAWIRSSAPALLVPDWKAFEKTAADMGGPIEWAEEPRALIASVL